uniref:Thioredoxin domain-containing protein n=1 Tax=Gopherus agassizii TaxID=38772 RepID=A0A452J2U2_9SAUR
ARVHRFVKILLIPWGRTRPVSHWQQGECPAPWILPVLSTSTVFYAPWCPACQQIEAAWENFAKESDHLDITVGKVDVTQEPGTQGIIVITVCLLLSAMDGVFRRYRGSRTSEDLQGYILERKWEAVEPVAGWKSPSSIMMHGMAGLFHFSGWIRVSNTNHYCSI